MLLLTLLFARFFSGLPNTFSDDQPIAYHWHSRHAFAKLSLSFAHEYASCHVYPRCFHCFQCPHHVRAMFSLLLRSLYLCRRLLPSTFSFGFQAVWNCIVFVHICTAFRSSDFCCNSLHFLRNCSTMISWVSIATRSWTLCLNLCRHCLYFALIIAG